MKKIAAVIGSAVFAFIAVSSAQASRHEGYEDDERYEHGNYYNPYGYNYGYNNYGYNTTYRNHELREYGGRYMNSAPIYGGNYSGSGYVDDDAYKYNNSGYRNHERYEYGR